MEPGPGHLSMHLAGWAYLIEKEQSLKDRSRLFILFLPMLDQGPSIGYLVYWSTQPEGVAPSNGTM